MATKTSAEPCMLIRARGVRVHNLKNVDVDIVRGGLVAVCGVSGSGKTSLALDTLYAEGQRRYIESFSAYTRQFLERLEKPDFDRIDGLPPALAVTRGPQARGNRSTVGTASETLDYLRLVFAHAAELYCSNCGQLVVAQSPQSAAKWIEGQAEGRKLMLACPVYWADVEERAAILADFQQQGYVRLLSNGRILHLGRDEREDLAIQLPESTSGSLSVWVILDRLRGGAPAERSTESLEDAFELGHGTVGVFVEGEGVGIACEVDGSQWHLMQFDRRRFCQNCQLDFPPAEARLFSFNSPLGACELCEGFGDTIDLDPDLIFPDRSRTIREGGIAPWGSPAYAHNLMELLDVADELGLPVDRPLSKLRKREFTLLMDGDPERGFEGIRGFFRWLERKKYKMHVRVFLSRYRSYNRCSACHGQRLNPAALAYRLGGKNFAELCELQIAELSQWLRDLDWEARSHDIAAGPLEQVLNRLGFLQAVGLGYLQLNRTLRTLSGGEAQRTALTAALGSTLVNMLYVLDEPSAGLHPHDVEQLGGAIERLAGRGNTVLMVEHEEALLRRADQLIEVGPAAGARGGKLTYNGPVSLAQTRESQCLTLDYLRGQRQVPVPSTRRSWTNSLRLSGCRGHNLQNLDVEFPLNVLCVVTGVSGSGKSSLVQDTLYGAVARRLHDNPVQTLEYKSLVGAGQIDDCISVDQSPVSRSPRSNPVTYVKAFDEIRAVFAESMDSKTRNLSPGHFSFNSDLGRCPQCKGDGQLQIDMQFLADVSMACPTCRGSRYRSEILAVRYRDKSIADVLDMTVNEAATFFRGQAKVQAKLKVLSDVGLGYLHLGQPATTLSSGEAQRLKLAGFLAAANKRRSLFLLDEPTTGLHAHDLTNLLACFDALLNRGHSLVVVEHNVHVMAAADYLIDLGPGPAEQGGRLVATGTPEEVAKSDESTTAKYLRSALPRHLI